MKENTAKHTDECLIAALKDERRRNSQAAIYQCASGIAAAFLRGRIDAADFLGIERIEELSSKVVLEASIMAISLWDDIDYHLNEW